MSDITTAELAAALIAVFEGERLTAYPDSGGVLTIGIGHTKDVHEGDTITHGRALELFAADAAPLLEMVKDLPILEGAGLVSFGYNVGQGALRLVMGGHDTISNPRHFTDRKGNVLHGLESRRRLEETLILLSDQMGRNP